MFPSMAPFYRVRKKPFVILGCDPGTSNFGLAVTKFKQDGSFTPVWAGKFGSMVRDSMDNLPKQYNSFLAEFSALTDKFQPDAVVIERFMNRGKFSGDQGEYVSMALALIIRHLQQVLPKCKVLIVQPGVWKLAFSRARGGNGKRIDGERNILEQYTDHCLAESHEFDAYCMTHFARSKIIDQTPFSHLSGKAGEIKMVEDFEKIASGKKKRRRR